MRRGGESGLLNSEAARGAPRTVRLREASATNRREATGTATGPAAEPRRSASFMTATTLSARGRHSKCRPTRAPLPPESWRHSPADAGAASYHSPQHSETPGPAASANTIDRMVALTTITSVVEGSKNDASLRRWSSERNSRWRRHHDRRLLEIPVAGRPGAGNPPSRTTRHRRASPAGTAELLLA